MAHISHSQEHATAMNRSIEANRNAADIMATVAQRTLADDFSRSFYRGLGASVWTPAFADKSCSVYDVIQTIDKQDNETFEAMREIVCRASMGLDVQELASSLIGHLKRAHAAQHAEDAL